MSMEKNSMRNKMAGYNIMDYKQINFNKLQEFRYRTNIYICAHDLDRMECFYNLLIYNINYI